MLFGLFAFLSLLASASAFDITFPGPSDYWVACGWNNMTWKSSATDPQLVTIMLTNSNKTLLNDDYEVGNALQGDNNAAMIYVPCLPAAGDYSLMLVNASHYNHDKKDVLYTSPPFSIKPKGTAPDPESHQSSIPSEIQPYLETPGIVLPSSKKGDVTNTTANGNGTEQALPKLDGAASNFGSFNPTPHPNSAVGSHMVHDVLFIVVIAAFTALVVTT